MKRPPELSATGARVTVRTVRAEDVEPYRAAVEASRHRLARWNPVDPHDLVRHLAAQSDQHRTFVVLARTPEASHPLVGRVNLANVVGGRFRSAALGYDAYDPYVGRGLFREGLRLVVDVALAPVDAGGAGLHRVEANVQPGNATSAGVLRSLGFRHEGRTPRMLYLPGPGGERWRDLERYAVTVEEWPAPAYAPHDVHREVVLVTGPADDRTAVARALGAELVLPVLSGVPGDRPWELLGRCPGGAVVEGGWGSQDRAGVEAGLRRAGVDPSHAVEVHCEGTSDPVGLGPVLRTAVPPGDDRARTALALGARALAR